MKTVLLVLTMTALGTWWVHQANRTYSRISTCRYRDLELLAQQADRYSVGYVLVGLFALLFYPLGILATLGVFGYAAYRRFW